MNLLRTWNGDSKPLQSFLLSFPRRREWHGGFGMTIKTRFAPSPTGYLHVGGARTALFSWLYAKQHQGEFILRIEDTDQERSTQASIQAILDGMQWLGLTYDDGPFYQMQRMDRYQTCLQQLLNEGKAYYCYCSKESLEAMREQQIANKQKPRYDGRCRHQTDHPENTPRVIRFKNPELGTVKWHDLVKGDIEIANAELDDLIIARSDGTPTYNFTVVIDDWDMGITHVIRGDDHVNNTPRQINMLKALGAPIPEYAHVPMILGDDGKRLSKRHGAVGVMQYREDGFLPEALLNYLVRLGWSHGDQEIFSIQEMIDDFDIHHISNSPAAFNTEKLRWLNQHYIKTLPVNTIVQGLQYQYDQLNINTDTGPELDTVVPVMADRVHTLKAMAEQTRCYFEDFDTFDDKAAKKHLRPVAETPLKIVKEKLAQLDSWQAAILHRTVADTANELAIGMGKIGMPLRVAITGSSNSPDLGITLEWVGQQRTLTRIDQALAYMAQRIGD